MNIKSFALVLILGSFYSLGFAQKASKKNVNLPDDSKFVYSVVDNSYSGIYEAKNKNGDVITRGKYLNDQRVGNWFFLNGDNTLYLRYDYDNKKILFVDGKSIAFATIKINTEKDEDKKLASVPLPLISIEQYASLLTTLVKDKIPSEVKKAHKALKVDIVAEIDVNGKAAYLAQYVVEDKVKTQRFDLLGQNYVIDWIPASLNNKKLSSQFSFNTEFSFPKDEVGQMKRIKWDK